MCGTISGTVHLRTFGCIKYIPFRLKSGYISNIFQIYTNIFQDYQETEYISNIFQIYITNIFQDLQENVRRQGHFPVSLKETVPD